MLGVSSENVWQMEFLAIYQFDRQIIPVLVRLLYYFDTFVLLNRFPATLVTS
jgi:hypothetical protein